MPRRGLPPINRGTSLDGRNLAGGLVLVTGQIIDNVRIGPYVACVGRTIGTGDTVLPHVLGRKPNGWCHVFRNSSGGVIYDASTGIAAWSATSITLRATVAGTYSFLLL